MNLKAKLTDAFNIRPGEGLPIVLMGSYSFLAGICLAYMISLGNASFLVAFGTAYLPQGYIATGIVGYIAGSFLSVLQRRLSFQRLVVVSIAFLLVSTCAFRVGYMFPGDISFLGFTLKQWLALGLFVNIGPYIMLVYFVFRSLAGRLFDLRQGKRLFSLISTGDVLSSMFGFFSVPILLRLLPASTDLLIFAAASLGLCLWVLLIINRQFAGKLSDPPPKKGGNVQGGWGVLFQSRYFVLLLLLAASTVFGFYYIDYIFLAQLRERFPDQKLLAQFIGIFYGAIRVVEFILKTFVSGRLINQYGLRFGLVVLPILVCACSGFASLVLFAGLPSLVFLLLALDKLIERVVTKSLYEPAFNVLYQPVDPESRLVVQTRVEGIIQQLTVIFAGGSLVLFNWIGSFHLVINVVVVVFGGWVVVAILMNRAYREKLMSNLESQSQNDRVAGDEDVSTLVAARHLQNSMPEQSMLALTLLEHIDPAGMSLYLKQLLEHTDHQVKAWALQKIADWECVTLIDDVQALKSDAQLKDDATRTHAVLTDVMARTSETWLALVRSEDPAERVKGARKMLDLPLSDIEIQDLLNDPDEDVRRAALLTCVHSTQDSDVLAQVNDLALGPAVVSGLVATGEPALGRVRDLFLDQSQETLLVERFARVLGAIGGEDAKAGLFERLSTSDRHVHRQVLTALRLSEFRAEEDQIAYIRQEIETTVNQAAWCISALLDLEAVALPRLKAALGHALDENRECLFLLLSLIYDAKQIEIVRESFKSGSADGKVYALELIDVFVDQDLKEFLFPLLDDLPLVQRLRRLEDAFPQQRLSVVDRLKDIINRPFFDVDLWIKACALDGLAEIASDEVVPEQVATLFHPNAFLRETAAWSIRRMDETDYAQHLARLPEATRHTIQEALVADKHPRLMFEKITFLKTIPAFNGIPESELMDIAGLLERLSVEAGEVVFTESDFGQRVFVIVEGQVRFQVGDQHIEHFSDGAFINTRQLRQLFDQGGQAFAETVVHLFALDEGALYGVVADRAEMAAGLLRARDFEPQQADISDLKAV